MVRLTALWLALIWSGIASAEGTARDWFERMIQAARGQNYQGVLMYGDQRHWDTLAIRHAVIDGVEYEHLQPLTGLPREQLRHGPRIHCRHAGHPEQHPQPLQNPLHSFLPGHDLNEHYQLTLGGNDRVAGHYAQRLMLQPNDRDRFAMHLWLDQQTALLLRSELLDEQGRVLERVQFAHVDIGGPAHASAFALPASFHELPLPQHPADTGVGWGPHWLPAGFERLAAAEQGNVIRLLYADGLAAFSVFIDRGEQPLANIDQQWGATAAVVRQVSSHDGEVRRVTAVGELPVTALLKIVSSVQPYAAAPEQEQP